MTQPGTAGLGSGIRTALRTVLLIVFSLLLGIGATRAQPQPEYPFQCGEGQEGASGIPIRYGSYGSDCSISPLGDLDRFKFVGAAGDRIRITVLGASGCFDPVLEVRDPLGVLVTLPSPGTCSGGPVCNPFCSCFACSFTVELTLDRTGTYTLFVSDSGNDEEGAYVLSVERLPPTYCEPNLRSSGILDDSIDPSTDTDFVRFEGAAGTLIRLTLVKPSADCMDPRIEMFDPDGLPVSLPTSSCSGGPVCNPFCACSTCSIANDLSLTKTGTYKLVLGDVGADEIGAYHLSLNCLVGDCPLSLYPTNLRFISKSCMTWDFAQDTEACYDIVEGNLPGLLASHGDYTTAIVGCEVTNDCDNHHCLSDPPPPSGQGRFFLVRGNGSSVGSYDNEWGPAQHCGNDAAINASLAACP